MSIELDHVFICTAVGAPEAQALLDFGLHEAPPNDHGEQGTACRRFSFSNAMLELVWVSNESAARATNHETALWDRWARRARDASPYGVVVRPSAAPVDPPFPAVAYKPSYLGPDQVIYIGEAGIEEPMWVYLDFLRREFRERWFVPHPAGVREITKLAVPGPCSSATAQVFSNMGVFVPGTDSVMELWFSQGEGTEDFRPGLPLKIHY